MKLKRLQNNFIKVMGLQIAVATIYCSFITYLIKDKIIEALYYYPIYSGSIFVLILLCFSLWLLSFGYANMLASVVFKTKCSNSKNRRTLFMMKPEYMHARSVIILRDSFIIFVLILLLSYNLNGLIELISN